MPPNHDSQLMIDDSAHDIFSKEYISLPKTLVDIIKLPSVTNIPFPQKIEEGKCWVQWHNIEFRHDENNNEYYYLYNIPNKYPKNVRLDYKIALEGGWTPTERLIQGWIVKHFETPTFQKLYDHIIEQNIGSNPQIYSNTKTIDEQTALRGVQDLAIKLTVRARYFLAEKNDVQQAIQQLEAILQLLDILKKTDSFSSIFYLHNIYLLVNNELASWMWEHNFTKNQIRQIDQLLSRHHYDYKKMWKQTLDYMLTVSIQTLDKFYTTGRNKNGWLVLQESESSDSFTGMYNFFSPLFEDRQNAANRVEMLYHKISGITDMPYSKANNIITLVDRAYIMPTDRASLLLCARHYVVFDILIEVKTICRGISLLLALNSYYVDHDRYPKTLTDLVPDYIPSIPIDTFSGKPLLYRYIDETASFVYSVGKNEIDDGAPVYGLDDNVFIADEDDLIINPPRNKPNYEWILVTKSELKQEDEDVEPY